MMMKMAQVVRPLCNAFQLRLIAPISGVSPNSQQQKKKHLLPYSSPSSPLDFQSRGLRLLQTPLPSDVQESSGSDSEKSRNQKKREARRAVQWGMELASFSDPQIKQILRIASLDQEVFNAITLVKRFGPDVREGKRRQYNYIGRLLREAQPELMDDLIRATKDGDQSKLQELSGAGACIIEEGVEGEGETDIEGEEEGSFTVVASRWSDGLINKDSEITNEVYSIHNVEFDRQELRKLVRRVHKVVHRRQLTEENKAEIEAALAGANKSLNRFLRALAKQMMDYEL